MLGWTMRWIMTCFSGFSAGAGAWISAFWLRLRGAPVLGVLPVHLRASRPFGFAKTPISGAQHIAGFASLAFEKVLKSQQTGFEAVVTLLKVKVSS